MLVWFAARKTTEAASRGQEVTEPAPHRLCTFLFKSLTSGAPLCSPIPQTPTHTPVVVLQIPLPSGSPPFPQVTAGLPCLLLHPSYPSSSRSRPVVQVNASLHFEPPKINIFHRDCKRSGRDATCLAAFLCFTPIFLAPNFEAATVGKRGPSLQSPTWTSGWFCSKPGLLLRWVLSAKSYLEPPWMTARCPFNTLISRDREGVSCQGELAGSGGDR